MLQFIKQFAIINYDLTDMVLDYEESSEEPLKMIEVEQRPQ